MPRRTRSSSGRLVALRPSDVPPPPRHDQAAPEEREDASPSSEIRPLPQCGPTRFLLVSTWLRGAEAESTWVTVTDATGRAHFEGPLLPNGRVTVAVDAPASVDRVCVRLETVRWHRQAEIVLRESSSACTFT